MFSRQVLALCVGPGATTDSVDEDDGAIDGSGTGGHSYFANSYTVSFFFSPVPNGYPKKVGIAWTDGGPGPIYFQAFGTVGEGSGEFGPFLSSDFTNTGGTAEDIILAVSHPVGISKITVQNVVGTIEVDHLQLDRCIVCGDTTRDLHVRTADALASLRKSVGIAQELTCPVCDFE